MRKIPEKLLKEILADPYYKKCCLTGEKRGKIDFHHVWIYAGKQINERFAIMPVLEKKHSWKGDPDSAHNCKETREKIEFLSLLRATPEELAKYPKVNWEHKKNYLKKKYDISKRLIL